MTPEEIKKEYKSPPISRKLVDDPINHSLHLYFVLKKFLFKPRRKSFKLSSWDLGPRLYLFGDNSTLNLFNQRTRDPERGYVQGPAIHTPCSLRNFTLPGKRVAAPSALVVIHNRRHLVSVCGGNCVPRPLVPAPSFISLVGFGL